MMCLFHVPNKWLPIADVGGGNVPCDGVHFMT